MNSFNWKVFWKKHRDIPRTIATSKMELFMGSIISLQPLTNFIKNLNIVTMGVLNLLQEYYNGF